MSWIIHIRVQLKHHSLNAEALLDQVKVDVMAEGHAILEGTLVVRLCSLCLYVLLNGIDLRLILDEFLLNIVQSNVDVALKNLVLLGVVLHRVVSHLLREA